MLYLLLFHCNNGYANVPQCNVISTSSCFKLRTNTHDLQGFCPSNGHKIRLFSTFDINHEDFAIVHGKSTYRIIHAWINESSPLNNISLPLLESQSIKAHLQTLLEIRRTFISYVCAILCSIEIQL